jgi:D-alanyl-lipoteichoic acid acyltransferase DltB (MBOAT superfamily)
VSFFTFQAMSYVLDVARRDVEPQKNFVRFGLYVFLFPHLIAGPIVRYRDIEGQLVRRDHPHWQFAEGVRRLILGIGKKAILAAPLAERADAVFLLPRRAVGRLAWLGVFYYALQIFLDFSAYSTWRSAWARCSASTSSRTSTTRTSPGRSRSSGGAGTSRSRRGSATTSTSRSAATGAGRGGPTAT